MTEDSEPNESEADTKDTGTKNPLDAIQRTQRITGVKTGHLTGHYGYDAETGDLVVDTSSQPIQSAKDRFQAKKDDN